MVANSKQVGGDHYQDGIQPWDYILSHDLGYLEGNIIKYVTCYKRKNGVQDLQKALHYLEKLIEIQNGGLQPSSTGNRKTHKTVQRSSAKEPVCGSATDSGANTSGSETIVQRNQNQGYTPVELRDII